MLKTKSVTIYETEDRKEFRDLTEAAKHQKAIELCKEVQALLPPRIKMLHATWVQHPLMQYRTWRRALVQLTQTYFPDIYPGIDPMEIHPHSYLARVVDDCGPEPLRSMWSRLACFSDDGREFDQPYFSLHPHEAKGPMAASQ